MAHTYHRYKPGSEPVAGYKVTVCLGAGGFGEVWKGVGPGGTEVAIKIIDLTGQQGVQEFKSLRLVKKCIHPNLVPIHAFWLKDEEGNVVSDESADLGADGKDVRSTSEFVKPVELIIVMGLGKKCLNKRLQEVRDDGLAGIPGVELLDYMDAAARGIDYLNSQVGIVHGDIKPHNILVVGDAAAVCDFGLARAVESLRKTSMAPMTVAYAAPESFRGKPTVKSDQYSLAITYIELRTGRMPFDEGLSPFDLMNTHVTGQLNLDRLPPYEREVIRRATALNPDDRWNNNRDFVRSLSRAFDADPQAKLAPGAPYAIDLEAEGFVATLKRDSRSSSLRGGEFNRQTRENINRGVTPTVRPSLERTTDQLPESSSSFSGDYQSSFDFSENSESQAASGPTVPINRAWLWIAVVVAVLGIGGFAASSFLRGPSVEEQLATAALELGGAVDRSLNQRDFVTALDHIARFSRQYPVVGAEPVVAQKRELVRIQWLGLGQQLLQSDSTAEFDKLAAEMLTRFPNDSDLAKLVASKPNKIATKPSTTANRFDMSKLIRDTDALAAGGRWIDAMTRLDLQPPKLDVQEIEQFQQQAAKIRLQWVAAVRGQLEAGNVAVAQQELAVILGRYSLLFEARAQLVRAHLAQSSFTLARAELDKLQQAALPPEGREWRDALLLILDLRTQRREAAALYGDLLKLPNLDAAPDLKSLWSLTSAERELLKNTRDTLLDAEYVQLVKSPRSPQQLVVVEKLLAHMPARKYDLLLMMSEIQLDAGECSAANESLTAAEKVVGELTRDQTVDHKARRLLIELRDPQSDQAKRAALIDEAEKLQPSWQPARRSELGKVFVSLVMEDRATYDPAAMRLLLAAIKLEPLRADLYTLIRAIRGDEWNPRVAKRLDDTTQPTREQWQQLFDDCVALRVLAAWPDNRMRAICQAARAEAMCELGLKLDSEALDVMELGNGWPAEGYIYYVGARVAWASQASSERVKSLVAKALGVRQKPVQLEASFRQTYLQQMQSGAAAPRKTSRLRPRSPFGLLGRIQHPAHTVGRLTAARTPPGDQPARSPTSDDHRSESRQDCLELFARLPQLPIAERVAAWQKLAPRAEAVSRQKSDAALDQAAVVCYEELAATARIDMAESFRRAVAAATRWVEREPTAEAYTARARVYIRFTALRGSGLDHQTVFNQDRFTIGDRCEADLTKAIELAPRDAEPRRWLGRLKREQGDARGGDEIFVQALDLARQQSPASYLLAVRDWAENALLLEKFSEARDRADQLTRREAPPNLGPRLEKLAANIRGDAWFREGKWSAALDEYTQAARHDRLQPAALGNLDERDELLVFMRRAECRFRLLGHAPDLMAAQAERALADLRLARELAPDRVTQAGIHSLASQIAARAVNGLSPSSALFGELLAEGSKQAEQSLELSASSQESVTVRVALVRLNLHKAALLPVNSSARQQLLAETRRIHREARQLADQTGLATELGELLRLEDQL